MSSSLLIGMLSAFSSCLETSPLSSLSLFEVVSFLVSSFFSLSSSSIFITLLSSSFPFFFSDSAFSLFFLPSFNFYFGEFSSFFSSFFKASSISSAYFEISTLFFFVLWVVGLPLTLPGFSYLISA
jgi:hypothetical protein